MIVEALAVLAAVLAPRASWSLLTPPITSPAIVGQPQESSCACDSSSGKRQGMWGSAFLARPSSDCGYTMASSGPNDSLRSGRPRGAGSSGSSLDGPCQARATGRYISTWIPGANWVSRSVLHASTPAGAEASWMGSLWSSGGGNGGNGTDNGVSSGGGMGGDGNGGGGEVEIVWGGYTENAKSSQRVECRPGSSDSGGGVFLPWLWLSAWWGLYTVCLKQSPVVTKALTAGVLALGGDIAAQCFEFQQTGGTGSFAKDKRRVLAVAIDSMLISGPALHALYGVMEFFIPTSKGGWLPATCHILLDTFLLDPMFVASFFCVTGVLESRSFVSDVLPGLRREFWPAVRGSWAVSLCFCPLQYITFRYLPLDFRVLSVNVCDIVWTSVLSYFSHKAVPAAHASDILDNKNVDFVDTSVVDKPWTTVNVCCRGQAWRG